MCVPSPGSTGASAYRLPDNTISAAVPTNLCTASFNRAATDSVLTSIASNVARSAASWESINLNTLELSILQMVIDGKSRSLISKILGLPSKKISYIKTRALKKLSFKNKNEFYITANKIKKTLSTENRIDENRRYSINGKSLCAMDGIGY
ncbi:LuxR C-terminal-related transcriptional regulator [Yersinia enterocolitica]|nr:PprA [Yersinia enterocolitica]HDM8275215.1 PprA [Yersinia enterocolitica]HEB0982486.1 PprA [Yersinia enterocolitica]HEB1854088.1 PprA [Yersinia enterocolitica]